MFSFDNDIGAQGVKAFFYGTQYLRSQALLYLQAAGKHVYHTGEFA